MRALVALAALVLALAPAAAASPSQREVDRRVETLAAELRCPVCQNLSVKDSPSDVAATFRARIRELVLAGSSDEEIRAFFVARYGEWILLDPPRRGIALAVWLAPAVALGAGLLAAVAAIAVWRRRGRRAETPLAPERLARELEELDEELAVGELDERDHALLRERALRRADARPPARSGRLPRWRWPLAGAAAASVVALTLVPALRQRGPADLPTGNDFTAAGETVWLTQWRQAEAAMDQSQTERALERYRLAVAFAPDLPELRARFGFALAEAGRNREALAQLDRAVRDDPRLPLARLYLGAVLFKEGRTEEAVREWRRYLALDPNGEGAKLVRRILAEKAGQP